MRIGAILPLTAYSLLLSALLLCIVYLAGLAIYRLFCSPIAKFPGPKLAALSNWYEFYYDVYLEGKFTVHIQDLHKKYGPIIRITPTELHILDPEYYDQLYTRTGRRDKMEYMSPRFGAETSMLTTTNHDHHRVRRMPLNPMFSRKNIIKFQPVIHAKLEKLCRQLERAKETRARVRISRAYNAFAGDIISQYCFGESYDHLDSPDFKVNFHESFVAAVKSGQVALHFPWLQSFMQRLPHSLVLKMQPVLAELIRFQGDLLKQISKIEAEVKEGRQKNLEHPTIFHELLNSSLPPQEKTTQRLAHEAQVVLAAGLETTAWALSVGTFYILNNANIHAALRRELEDAIPDPSTQLDWLKLERLPYLVACVKESIRLSYGVTSRLPRVAPNEVLQYKEWTIPKGTPVSMTPYHIYHYENIFPESSTFRPERWFDNPKTNNGESLDRFFFSMGTRSCLGQNLAWAELHMAIATVFRRFALELYETDIKDVTMVHDYFIPFADWSSKGVMVKVTGVHA